MHQRVDAIGCAAFIVRPLGVGRDEARVIDDEFHIGVALGDDADVAALAVFVGLLAERNAFVNTDHVDAELARFFNQARAGPVRKKRYFLVRSPLGIGFPCADAPAFRRDGTKDNTIMSVSLSKNTSLINSS